MLPLLGISALAGYASLRTLEAAVERQLQEDLELLARALHLPLSRALERRDLGSLSQTLESVFSTGRVYGTYVYDGEGRQVAAFGHEDRSPQRASGPGRRDKRPQGEYGRMAGEDVYSYFVPLPDSVGRISGLLQVTRRKSDFEGTITKLRLQAAGLLVLAGLGMTALIFFGHYGAVGRHLSRLARSMRGPNRGIGVIARPRRLPWRFKRWLSL